ncbi:MAG TPA: hypothetical protein VHX44_16870 [Planctomycetota bacterium]|nr:hypothetical protein [Planctomycetota bacterium]
MAKKNVTDLRFGRYSLFANRSPSLTTAQLGTVSVTTGKDSNGKDIITQYQYGGPVTVAHSWMYGQISGLEKAVGFYGLCDYMPANAIYAYYAPWDSGCYAGGLPKWLVDPGGDFNNGDGGQQTPRGKYRNSYQTSYGIIPILPSNPNGKTLRDLQRHHWRLGYDAQNAFVDAAKSKTETDEFNEYSILPEDLLAVRPANWPGLTVSVQRFIKNNRFVNLARVEWTNPMTGQTAQVSFTGFGTTLRGARQQRKSGSGWAK